LRDAWEKKIKSFAWSPAQSILMVMFMLWMQGSALSIFTIFFIFSVIMQPIRGLMGVNQGTIVVIFLNSAFKPFEGHGVQLFPYKIIYGGIQMVVLAIGFYKFYTMGLLPLSPADWIDLIPHQHVTFFSYIQGRILKKLLQSKLINFTEKLINGQFSFVYFINVYE
jgi:hypothetical protein